ncbi:MAG: hypothetical protein ACYCUW_04640 [bacterium]
MNYSQKLIEDDIIINESLSFESLTEFNIKGFSQSEVGFNENLSFQFPNVIFKKSETQNYSPLFPEIFSMISTNLLVNSYNNFLAGKFLTPSYNIPYISFSLDSIVNTYIEKQSLLIDNYNQPNRSGSPIDMARQHCQAILQTKKSILQQDVITSLEKQISIMIDIETWDTEDKEPSIFSFFKLVLFYELNQNLKPASITINNNGHFAATWLLSKKELIKLEFNPNDMVRWFIFIEHIESTKTGFASSSDIKNILERYNVWDLMSK